MDSRQRTAEPRPEACLGRVVEHQQTTSTSFRYTIDLILLPILQTLPREAQAPSDHHASKTPYTKGVFLGIHVTLSLGAHSYHVLERYEIHALDTWNQNQTNDASLQVSMSLLVGYLTWHRTPI
jgi:hypothetical protein